MSKYLQKMSYNVSDPSTGTLQLLSDDCLSRFSIIDIFSSVTILLELASLVRLILSSPYYSRFLRSFAPKDLFRRLTTFQNHRKQTDRSELLSEHLRF